MVDAMFGQQEVQYVRAPILNRSMLHCAAILNRKHSSSVVLRVCLQFSRGHHLSESQCKSPKNWLEEKLCA